MRFRTLVIKNILRRPLRSALTVAAIAVAIGAVVALVGVAGGFESTFLRLYDSAGIDLIVVQKRGKLAQLNGSLDEKLGDQIAKIPGVRAVLTSLTDVISLEDYGLQAVVVQGWPAESAVFDHVRITAGRSLGRSDRRELLLGAVLARNLELKPGDTLELMDKEHFTVVGVFETENTFENGSVVIPLPELQRLMSKPGQVTGYSVGITEPANKAMLAEVRGRIEALAPRVCVTPTREYVGDIAEIKLAKGMSFLTSAIALLIGLFGMTNTTVMSVHERTRELGILRAVGWRPWRVAWLVVTESMTLGLLGAALGAVAAVALVRGLSRLPAVNGLIEGAIDWRLVATGFALAVGISVLGSVLPVWRILRMPPIQAIRHE